MPTRSQMGKVWYLTIQEGWVEGGASQRRAGQGGGQGVAQLFEGHAWGRGCAHLIHSAHKEDGAVDREGRREETEPE